MHPDIAEELFTEAAGYAEEKYQYLNKLSKLYDTHEQ